ncbi:MAG: hypothetical protein M3O15_07950 [Acidobacteriota bacterium]|nr:hypothetical protein [Acidobacteriota bacterium]
MKKTVRKLALHRESLRNLTASQLTSGGGATPRPTVAPCGRTTEYTWYCPSRSACTVCPICA